MADEYPDSLTRMHMQVRLMGNFGLNGSIPWLKDTKGTLICKEDIENLNHFLIDCPQFTENFDSIWHNLEPRGGGGGGGGRVSELMDRQGCAILALDVVPKNLFDKISCLLFQQGNYASIIYQVKMVSSLWQVAKIN